MFIDETYRNLIEQRYCCRIQEVRRVGITEGSGVTMGCAGEGSRIRVERLDHGETYDVGYGTRRQATI